MRVCGTDKIRQLEAWDEREQARQEEIREGLNRELRLQPEERKSYIVSRGKTDYLAQYIKSRYAAKGSAAYTIYKYDACRFRDLLQAKRAVLH